MKEFILGSLAAFSVIILAGEIGEWTTVSIIAKVASFIYLVVFIFICTISIQNSGKKRRRRRR